ncbi:alpha-L-fucosidase [Limisphaera ngatamarikiensis]|uniref:alpha-L-fucosidase n=1 Tax=Limisphaera ngatamarikiensis TaxID=1324935 RepID=A0A6M1S069_9BACT|nr:alpha-L-fucosidase [Limisphaera ngatamarikiensis]NGO38770.1 alpha-L-fucosidase [Limisphaera ngatamarikiensis]
MKPSSEPCRGVHFLRWRRLLYGLSLWIGYCGLVQSAPAGPGPNPPRPYGPVPTERQLRWHEMEFYGFLHFTVNTFTDKEWGYGDEDPAVFRPTDFDADQIVRVAREAGMRGLILTAKHHDGFCLWPSAYTEHSVKRSPWREGRGDVVREISEACRRHGLRFGVYLSPWDRNHPEYGRAAYVEYYRNQLRELLTGYGELFAVWFDGANGGDGYYGGARETRRIDNRTYYGWPETWALVRQLQPMACMFSDAGPDFRWIGNERGIAGDPCWATLDLTKPGRYPGGSSEGLEHGERPGTAWVPAECDVSIRPGWFYHPAEDDRVKSPEELVAIYYASVGRGCCLNLNIPPDRRGRIHENDIRSLQGFRRFLDATFSTNLAGRARVSASAVRAPETAYAATHLLDGRRDTYWCTPDDVLTPWVEFQFPYPVRFNVVELREYLPLGQRVEAVSLDLWAGGQWTEFARATSLGNRRLIRLPQAVETEKVRLRVTRAAACPALSEFGLYLEPGR